MFTSTFLFLLLLSKFSNQVSKHLFHLNSFEQYAGLPVPQLPGTIENPTLTTFRSGHTLGWSHFFTPAEFAPGTRIPSYISEKSSFVDADTY